MRRFATALAFALIASSLFTQTLMAQTFTEGPAVIIANVEKVGPTRAVLARAGSAKVTMVDPGGQWPASPDPTRHVKIWGIQIKRGSADWVWWLFQGDPADSNELADGESVKRTPNPDLWDTFGSHTRSGGLPFINVSTSDLGEAAGFLVRLAILTDANITLSATITVN